MSLTAEAQHQINIGLTLFAHDVERRGAERAKSQLAISLTWADGHTVDECNTCEAAANLLVSLGGFVSYRTINGQQCYVEIIDGKFITTVRL